MVSKEAAAGLQPWCKAYAEHDGCHIDKEGPSAVPSNPEGAYSMQTRGAIAMRGLGGVHLAVALPDELGGLSGVSGLQLTGRHDDGGDVQLLVGQRALEGLSLSLSSPDTCSGSQAFSPGLKWRVSRG